MGKSDEIVMSQFSISAHLNTTLTTTLFNAAQRKTSPPTRPSMYISRRISCDMNVLNSMDRRWVDMCFFTFGVIMDHSILVSARIWSHPVSPCDSILYEAEKV